MLSISIHFKGVRIAIIKHNLNLKFFLRRQLVAAQAGDDRPKC